MSNGVILDARIKKRKLRLDKNKNLIDYFCVSWDHGPLSLVLHLNYRYGVNWPFMSPVWDGRGGISRNVW